MNDDDTIPIRLPVRRRRSSTIGLVVIGVAMIAVAVGIVANLFLYTHTAKADAAALSSELARKVASANHGNTCSAPPPSAPTAAVDPRMLLSIPAIGLTAPVLEGTDDHVLDTGIGHVSTSKWPDQGGTDVLAAHNATFFVHLPNLKPGDTITLTAPCREWTYRVSTQQVVTNTTPVPATSTPTLALVTCWPIDALFNTANRYLLTADLVSANNNVHSAPTIAADALSMWKATLPAGLVGVDLSNAATGVVTGRLATVGTPSAAWQSSPASLNAVGPAVELFGGTVRAVRTDHPTWLDTIAPGVARNAYAPMFAAPSNITFRSPLDFTVAVAGDTLTKVVLATSMQIGSGTYRLAATATPTGNRLSLSAWSLTLTSGTSPTPSPAAAPQSSAKPTAAKPTVVAPTHPSSASTVTSPPASAPVPPKTTSSTPASPSNTASNPDPSSSPAATTASNLGTGRKPAPAASATQPPTP